LSTNPPPIGNISDVVQPQDLTTWAQIAGVLRYLVEPIEAPPGATGASPIAVGVMADTFLNTYAAARQSGLPHVPAVRNASTLATLLGIPGDVGAWIGQTFGLILGPFAAGALAFLDGLRKGIDPTVGNLAVQVLNEFLGTDVTVDQMPFGLGIGDHLARARSLGQLLLTQLTTEFAPAAGGAIAPSTAPAATFTGLAVNFGIASAIMGVIGGLLPEVHMDELRELGEEVAQNIGLGRLVRRALTPLVQILVAKPMEWYLNTQYTPTQFTLSELVNPYAQTALDTKQIFTAMNLLGYSNDKIQAVIEMHRKRLTPADIYLLSNYSSAWDSQAVGYIEKLNYPPELAPTVLLVEELKAERSWTDKLIAELETAVKEGSVTIDEFETVVRGLPYSKAIQDIIIGTVQYKVNTIKPRIAHLSYAQLKTAFDQGFITMSEAVARWTKEGFDQEDIDVLEFLLLFDLQKTETAAAAKAAKAAKAGSTTPKVPPGGGKVV